MCNDDQIRSNGIVIIKILFTYCHPQLPYWALWIMKYYSIPTPPPATSRCTTLSLPW